MGDYVTHELRNETAMFLASGRRIPIVGSINHTLLARTTNKTSHSRPGYPESLAKRTMVPRMLSPLHQSATANHKRRPSPFIAATHRYPVWRQNLLPRRRRAGEFVLHPLLCLRNQSPWTPTRFLLRPNPISVANPQSQISSYFSFIFARLQSDPWDRPYSGMSGPRILNT
jgi:hypothetical protein